jgi:hypothetical protein
MKKWFKYVISIIVIAFLYLLIFPVSVPINKTIPAIEVSIGDKSFCAPVNITISGKYQWRLFRADTFTGNIQFDTYKLTMEKTLEQTDNIPALTLQNGVDSLDYGEWMSAQLFGYISCKPFFKKLVVQVYKPNEQGGSWSSVDGHCIVAEAKSREEALTVLKSFSNDRLPSYKCWK